MNKKWALARFLLYNVAWLLFLCNCNMSKKALQKAQTKQQVGEYADAILWYKKALNQGAERKKTNYLIAENLRYSNKIKDALPYYASALNAGLKDDRALFYYAQSLKANNRYAEAKASFQQYAKSGLNKSLVEQSKKELAFFDNLKKMDKRTQYFLVKLLPSSINTPGPEYAPLLIGDDTFYYTGENTRYTYKALGSGFTDVYLYQIKDWNTLSGEKKNVDAPINKAKTHEACIAISPDQNTMYFVRSNDGSKKGTTDTDIYTIEMQDGMWQNAEIVSSISDIRYWESSPALSPDGKTLYFSSNRRGGFGGQDIWFSTYSDSAGWSKPENMGFPVNTPGNEMFPYVRWDGQFYFASDGHPGFGQLDLFLFFTDSISKEKIVYNMGKEINSTADDISITFFKNQTKKGLFASNRAGGVGDDDIYFFEEVYKPMTIDTTVIKHKLTVVVTGDNNGTSVAISSANVSLKTDVAVLLEDTITNSDGIAIFEVDSSISYQIQAEAKGYFTNGIHFNTLDKKHTLDTTSEGILVKKYVVDIRLSKLEIGKEIVLENIYYDYNKADIRPDAEPELKRLADFLLKNTDLFIELGSHTDSRGDDTYNFKLSKLRAKSAVDFLVSNGVEPSRVIPIGYGETKHLIPDAETEEEHQKNRRTEFKIIKLKNNSAENP